MAMIFEDFTRIETAPVNIFQFFENMEENYTKWHPDHITFKWLKGRGLKEGNISYFEETIGGELLKKRVLYTKIIPNRYIGFVPVSRLMRIILRKMTFTIGLQETHCKFKAQVQLKWVGPLARKLNKEKFRAVREHMREEGENLKMILED